MREYFLGRKYYRGGSYSEKEGFKHFYDHVPASWFWKELYRSIGRNYIPKVGLCGESGVYLRIGDTFREFFWKPVCPFWINSEGEKIKSKQFQYLKFTLGHYDPKERTMNETTETFVELVDTEGNVTRVPATITTGRDGEAAPAETAFIAEEPESAPVGYSEV